jgi:hypothetical protein
MSNLIKNEDEIVKILRNLPLFASHFLNIRTKAGIVAPFELNRAQIFLHEKLEQQLRDVGIVRAIILKGRQGGCSTYVQARFFHKVCTQVGKKAFILTHEAEATKNLFDMTKRYCDLMEPGVIPSPDTNSAKHLNFKALNSEYSVGTAGNKGVGRSQTLQLLHASEVAYYQNADEHSKGIFQSVSSEPGTEIIMESTANGMGGYFFNVWQSAISGESEYIPIFLPWYWQLEYTSACRKGEESLSEEEELLFSEHQENGLLKEHLYWRRKKLFEFSNDYETAREKFNVEYPFTASDAFQNPIADRFIKTNLVTRARKNVVESTSPLCIGVDPAISDLDRTAIIRRRGRLAYNLETYYNHKPMEIVGLVRRIIDRERPAKVCIDIIGIGAGIVDRLHELGYELVEGVCVARSATDKDKFKNQRAELWHDMREWLAQDMPVQIPDSDELMADLTCLGYKYDSSGRLQIESKDDLKKRGIRSPDTSDALCLTFTMGDYLNSDGYKSNYLPEKSKGMFI